MAWAAAYVQPVLDLLLHDKQLKSLGKQAAQEQQGVQAFQEHH